VWSAPIRSSFGWHVVRVDERRPGGAPMLEQVRARVERDWRDDRRREADAEARHRLRARYVVRREPSAP
jgi:parvulin-like peptidyl-prolyl isomerase